MFGGKLFRGSTIDGQCCLWLVALSETSETTDMRPVYHLMSLFTPWLSLVLIVHTPEG